MRRLSIASGGLDRSSGLPRLQTTTGRSRHHPGPSLVSRTAARSRCSWLQRPRLRAHRVPHRTPLLHVPRSRRVSRRQRRMAPEYRDSILDGADHSLALTHATQVAAEIASFLRAHPIGAQSSRRSVQVGDRAADDDRSTCSQPATDRACFRRGSGYRLGPSDGRAQGVPLAYGAFGRSGEVLALSG